jgi:glycosyltransferase involved in cell wall biosynthesis
VALSVSVALCTHNGERFIEEQLRSILGQTLIPTEIVVSDDASTDRTIALIESTIADWRKQYPDARFEVRFLHNPVALGVTSNFEQAILGATGDLIALSDQDDVWLPNRIERMVSVFDNRPDLLLLHTDAFLIDAVGRRMPGSLLEALEVSTRTRAAVHSGEALGELMKRNIVTGATTMFRRSLIKVAVPFPAAWLHDEWLAIVAASTGTVDLLEESLLEYRQHGANQVGAELLSFSDKVGRMLEPGTDRSRRLLVRTENLVARLDTLHAVGPLRDIAVEKLAHERARSMLGRRRLTRLVPIIRELRTGRYGLFGRGMTDAFRDLLQPLRGNG